MRRCTLSIRFPLHQKPDLECRQFLGIVNAEDAARCRFNDRYSQAGLGGADGWHILGLNEDEMVAVYSNLITHGVFCDVARV
jgi:hypothetical protein